MIPGGSSGYFVRLTDRMTVGIFRYVAGNLLFDVYEQLAPDLYNTMTRWRKDGVPGSALWDVDLTDGTTILFRYGLADCPLYELRKALINIGYTIVSKANREEVRLVEEPTMIAKPDTISPFPLEPWADLSGYFLDPRRTVVGTWSTQDGEWKFENIVSRKLQKELDNIRKNGLYAWRIYKRAIEKTRRVTSGFLSRHEIKLANASSQDLCWHLLDKGFSMLPTWYMEAFAQTDFRKSGK